MYGKESRGLAIYGIENLYAPHMVAKVNKSINGTVTCYSV